MFNDWKSPLFSSTLWGTPDRKVFVSIDRGLSMENKSFSIRTPYLETGGLLIWKQQSLPIERAL
jgi:hypothetical protein